MQPNPIMATQTVLPLISVNAEFPDGTIHLSPDFHIRAQDNRLEQNHGTPTNRPTDEPAIQPEPLGVLKSFTGTFAGRGFNTIFRPSPDSAKLGDNVLELNLTTETLSFADNLKSVPNRGTGAQNDIFLNGIPYVQTINDVTNPNSGLANNKPSGIHFEPGLWMHVPATTVPAQNESLTRMASIPHGTTINAQTIADPQVIAGPPTFPSVDITPFVIGSTNKVHFPSQTANQTSNIRLPPDLTKFIAAGTITQAILDNPNIVLSNAIVGQNITQTIVFTVATANASQLGNIIFLQGGTTPDTAKENADAVQMMATFWIEQVQYSLPIQPTKAGVKLTITPPQSNPNAQVPTFEVTPPRDLTQSITINVTATQIQYSQLVVLNFAGLSWPHSSVATLVPSAPIVVPGSVFPA